MARPVVLLRRMLARTRAGCVVGVEARPVDVEVHLVKGMPGFEIVGLPEAAVRESRVRVRAALANSGFEMPPRRVVLNLAPADLRKRGTTFDLAIAIGLLGACGACAPNRLEETLLFGELSLGGELRPARGLLPQLHEARGRGLKRAVIPARQLEEASLVPGLEVHGAHDLLSVVAFLNGELELPTSRVRAPELRAARAPCLSEVRGQAAAKRALEIAAAGPHHLLLVGPPGAGKTMLARRLPGLLPPPTAEEAAEIACIASAAGLSIALGAAPRRPLRAPHHTASAVSLVGGGDPIRPGEVTLAHGGVLFLDELPEFGRGAVEAFRTLMESGVAVVARARERVEMPAAPLVVAAMNPCPCGFDGDSSRLCVCPPSRVDAYRARVSGPILDRFDLHVVLPPVRLASLGKGAKGESSEVVRARVTAARDLLRSRGPMPGLGAALEGVEPASRRLLERAGDRLGLSMRGLGRALGVARTIAALAGRDGVQPADVAEALSYRLLDRRESNEREASLELTSDAS